MAEPPEQAPFDVDRLTDIERVRAFGALRWYFNTAHAMRQLFEQQFLPAGTLDEHEAHILGNIETVGALFTHWFAALYVVAEGWKDLRVQDKRIDALLRDGRKVALLRRFRNWVVHFQPERDSRKFVEFMGESNKANAARAWAGQLDEAFLNFFGYCDANKTAMVRWACLRQPPRDDGA